MFEKPTTIEEAFPESRISRKAHNERSRKAKAGEVLDIDKTHRFALFIDDDEVIDSALTKDFHDFNGQVVFVDGDG